MSQLYECEIFAGSAFRVTWGVNDGDAFTALEAAALGDSYALALGTAALPVTLSLGPALTLKAAPAPLQTGAAVTVQGALTMMSPDSDLVTLLGLNICGALYLLPLNPMRLGVSYALVAIDPETTALRMSELVTGCFAAGTRITMADGSLRVVETLAPGAMIRTRDHGPQALRWCGHISVRAQGTFAPVTFPAGVLGNLGPLTVGPLQRIFLYQRGEDRLGTQAEVLVQAQYLVDAARVRQRESGFVDYFSLVFDHHQIIYAEGIPVESMLVSQASLTRLPARLAEDLATRFPTLNQHAHFAEDIPEARMTPRDRASLLQDKGP